MNENKYKENVIDEIINFIKDNIHIYLNVSDEYFTKIRKYCKDNCDKDYIPISYGNLISLTDEVLYELFQCYHLYDLRSLE